MGVQGWPYSLSIATPPNPLLPHRCSQWVYSLGPRLLHELPQPRRWSRCEHRASFLTSLQNGQL